MKAPIRMSIRMRLTLYWAFVLAGVLLIAGETVFLIFQRQQWRELDGVLMEEADTAAETIVHLGPDSASAMIQRLGAESDIGPHRRVWLVWNGREIANAGDMTADLPVGIGAQPRRQTVDGERRIFRYAIVPFMLARAPAYIVDGVDAISARQAVLRLRTNLLLILPLVLMVSVAGGYWLAGRALVPINSMISGLAEIEPRNLSRRLSLSDVDDEVRQLTRAINSLLERVERASLVERRFAADAAHELRTPLTVLRTGLEIALSRRRSVSEYADALNAALREAVSLCRMADELLTLARLNEQAEVERAPLDLRTLVHEVADAVEPLVHAKHLTLQTSLNGRAVVDGNANHLRRLLINLLDNALKFTPESGSISVALDTREARAFMRIADSGPGIPDADLPFIFERFFRGKERTEAGSGLGLSLCREITRLHGGEISVTNRPQGGAEFVVSLPLYAPPAGAV